MDNQPVMILDCPACLQPLTTIGEDNASLVATPCGHLFHEECLPLNSRSQIQKCMSCSTSYYFRDVLQYYPVFSTPEEGVTTNLSGSPPNSPPFTLQQAQQIICGHANCEASGQQNQRLVQDYNALVTNSEELDQEIEKELTELQGLVRQTADKAMDLVTESVETLTQSLNLSTDATNLMTGCVRTVSNVSECLKRKWPETRTTPAVPQTEDVEDEEEEMEQNSEDDEEEVEPESEVESEVDEENETEDDEEEDEDEEE